MFVGDGITRTRAPEPQAASYPCARLRNWSRQTFWRYSLGTAPLFRQYPVLTIELRSGGTLLVPHCFSSSMISCTHFELHSTGPHEALVRVRSRAVIPRAEYESEVTIDCYSEKRVVRASGQAARPPNESLGGLRGQYETKTALHSRNRSFFFGPEARTISTIAHRTLNF